MTSYSDYQALLLNKGIRLQALGVAETALSRDDAIVGIELLRLEKVPILGGDV